MNAPYLIEKKYYDMKFGREHIVNLNAVAAFEDIAGQEEGVGIFRIAFRCVDGAVIYWDWLQEEARDKMFKELLMNCVRNNFEGEEHC